MQAYGTHSAHKGIVLSDLHLFTKRAKTITPDYIAGLCGEADYCILNGDIFDFTMVANNIMTLTTTVHSCHS